MTMTVEDYRLSIEASIKALAIDHGVLIESVRVDWGWDLGGGKTTPIFWRVVFESTVGSRPTPVSDVLPVRAKSFFRGKGLFGGNKP